MKQYLLIPINLPLKYRRILTLPQIPRGSLSYRRANLKVLKCRIQAKGSCCCRRFLADVNNRCIALLVRALSRCGGASELPSNWNQGAIPYGTVLEIVNLSYRSRLKLGQGIGP